MNKYCFRFVLVLIAIGGSVSAAQAQDFVLNNLTGETYAEVFFDNPGFTSPPPVHDAIQPQPSPDTLAFSEVQMNIGTVFNARAAAFQNAFGLNAAFAEVSEYLPELPGGFTAEAQTLYDVKVRSTRDLTGQTILFEFVINSGQLRIDDFDRFANIFGFGGASVGASIRLFGLGTWDFAARLTKDSSGDLIVTDNVSFSVGPFGFIAPFGNVDDFFGFANHPALTIDIVDADGDGLMDDAVVDIPKITGVILIDGADFRRLSGLNFTYKMAAKFDMATGGVRERTTGLAGITDPFAFGTPNDPSDDLGGPFSPLGVEFFLDGQSLSNFPAVPEPSTAAVVGTWLLGVAATRRRGANHE